MTSWLCHWQRPAAVSMIPPISVAWITINSAGHIQQREKKGLSEWLDLGNHRNIANCCLSSPQRISKNIQKDRITSQGPMWPMCVHTCPCIAPTDEALIPQRRTRNLRRVRNALNYLHLSFAARVSIRICENIFHPNFCWWFGLVVDYSRKNTSESRNCDHCTNFSLSCTVGIVFIVPTNHTVILCNKIIDKFVYMYMIYLHI